MFIRIALVASFFFLLSCAEEEEVKEPTDEHCSFKMSVSYNLGRNPANDFIAQNISGTASVDESTCPSIFVGPVTLSPKRYITRVDDTITFSLQVGAFEDTIFDFKTSGSSLIPRTLTHCENTYRTIEAIESGTLDVATNQVNFVVNYTIDKDACSDDGMDASGYLHTEIKGIWEEPCVSSTRHWVGFYGNGEVDSTDYFSNVSCTGRRMTVEMNGPTTVGSETSYPKSKTTSFQNYIVNVNDPALVTSFNGLSMCGFTNWIQGVDKNVKGRFCDFAANGIRSSVTFPAAETRKYDIFNKVGSVLTFGDSVTGDGLTAGTRPTSIDAGKPYNFNGSFVVVPVWLD